EVMSTLEKLAELKTKGILTQEEFDAKKTELLKKLT
ncbi:MAG: SHOCT domain-containing protein, partial [Gammaproteobacteria bacterium]